MTHIRTHAAPLVLLLLWPAPAPAQQWQATLTYPVGSGMTALEAKASTGALFACTGSVPGGERGGVHRSLDGGANWSTVFPGYIARTITVKPNGELLASVWTDSTSTEKIFHSADDGATWQQVWDAGLTNNVFAIAYDPLIDRAYNGSRYGIARNTSGGTSGPWTIVGNLPLGSWVRDIAVDKYSQVFVAVDNRSNPTLNGVYYSSSSAQSFTRIPGIGAGETPTTLEIVEGPSPYQQLLAGVWPTGVKNTQIGPGMSFASTYAAQADEEVSDIDAFALEVYMSVRHIPPPPGTAGTQAAGGGVWRSTDRGATWQPLSDGLPASPPVSALAALGTSPTDLRLFAGLFLGQNGGAPTYVLGGTTDVADGPAPPRDRSSWSHPNPFRRSTTIEFALPSRGRVRLTVHDVQGRTVAALLDEERPAGRVSAVWDGATASGGRAGSGLYFYRVEVRPVAGAPYGATAKVVLSE